jgi:serine phosphatase RsbU (regulator of sigma subunit)
MSLCTVAAVLLRERDGTTVADIVCAGHPPPLFVAGERVEPVGRFGPMLGAYDDEHWQRVTVTLDPGALLVLYTDGVLDTVGAAGNRFGELRLQTAVAGAAGASEAVSRIERALRQFEVGEQADDTAVLAVERLAIPDNLTASHVLSDRRP